MWTTGRQNEPSNTQIRNESNTIQLRRNFDLLAIPRRARAHSLDSIDTLSTIESHRQHRINYLEKRAKFEQTKDSLPVSPTSRTPSRPSSSLSGVFAPQNNGGSASPQQSESAADTISEMLEKITSELNLLQQEDNISTPKGPITKATVVERYIPAQVPMRATLVSAGSERSTPNSSKNRVSFDSAPSVVIPDTTDHRLTARSNSFQFQRPSTFLRQAPGRRDPHPPQFLRNQQHTSASLGRHSFSAAQNLDTLQPHGRQPSSMPITAGTPRPLRRHVSFSSVPLGDVPRRSTTSSVPVKTLIRKFSIDE